MLSSCSPLSSVVAYRSSTIRRQMCSLVVLGVPVLSIIIVSFISPSEGAIDTKQQLSYYQSLARHLNDFTVKDDAEDLLALPSDSGGPSVAVVAPPPSIARNGPITQYAATKAKDQQETKQQQQKYKKTRMHRFHRHRQAQQTEDNVAQESVAAVAYAPAPTSFAASNQILPRSDNDAKESSVSAAYAPAPASFTSPNKILHHRSNDNDNVAQESYQNNAYAPPPPPSLAQSSTVSASDKSYDQYQSSPSGSSTAAKDNQAQESYQSKSYAPPPASSNGYQQYRRTNTDSEPTNTAKDNQAQESYQRRAYAPSPSLTPAGSPPPPPPSESSKSYYDQYQRSSGGSTVTNDNHALESHQPPLQYAPPPPSSLTSDKSSPVTNGNRGPEPYPVSMSYAPPPPSAPTSSNYYPYHSPPYSPSHESPQPAPSSQNHRYYPDSPSQTSNHPAPYPVDSAALGSYAPFPATTPAPAIRAQYHRNMGYYSSPKPTLLQPANSRSSPSKNVVASASGNSPLLAHHPHLTSIDKYQQERKHQDMYNEQTSYSSPASSNSPTGYARETFEFSPAPPGPPGPPGPPPSATIESSPTSHHDQSSEEDSLQKQQKLLKHSIGTGVDIYKLALTSPGKLIVQALNFLASLRIPKDHYLNVISFVGVYLFVSILLYGQDDLKKQKCEDGDDHLRKEWHYHVGRRFVPAVKSVDKKMQKKFLKLFKGLHLLEDEEDGDDGSSEERSSPSIVNYVNDMCPRTAFFYSLAPMHLEARMQVQRILVAQPSPAHVYAAAKALLYKHKIHPKIWYLGLMAAALERPDMTGFKLAHPIDAIPDWFIPAHLIQDEMDKYRALARSRLTNKRVRRAASGNSTKVILTTTPRPSTTTTLSSTSSTTVTITTESSNITSSSTTTKFTRKPLLFTRRSTTTYRPPDFAYFSGDSGSVENIVLDGTPPYLKDTKYTDYIPYDEESINDSVQKFESINKNSDGKYKPKKKEKKPKPSKEEDQSQQQDQDASNSASVEQEVDVDASTALEIADTSAAVDLADGSNAVDTSGSTEADNASNNSGGGSNAASTEQNGVNDENISSINNIDGGAQEDDVAVILPAPPSVRPAHLTSSHHNAIKVGDLTVVVGSGPSLLNEHDEPINTYNLLDEKVKGEKYIKHSHRDKGHKKGHKKGKGKKGKGDDDKNCIVVDGKVGRDNGIENKLWYFREDMMVNQNHWYWHLIHPVNATKHPDRRAELFFFTHRQFLARYNAERLSNGLPRMIHMTYLGPGGILVEPYHSHLADVASGKYWTPRFPKRLLRDIRHEHNPDVGKNIMLKDTVKVYDRLVKSAKTGIMISKTGLLPIRNTKGIEPLANTVEATELSVNPFIYDAFGLHNMGHLVIGLIEDPDWGYKKTPGVMSEVATSMRDPIFYNYHAYIDNIMERHKETLPPYKVTGGEFPLLWEGIKILDMEMISKSHGPLNELKTFWTKKKFELAPSVDRSTDKDEHAKVCAVHLAHEPFTFKITIERRPCAKSNSGKGTIRIFIAPRLDEKGRRIHLREQRRLMIQLDAFQAKLRVGRNIITRRSHDSSLTQPWTKHLSDFEDGHRSKAADFCGCGWPQHLFIPKGHKKGMLFDLFVMVTNYDEDHVPNHPEVMGIPEACNSPYLFCGHPGRRYPDARPMGYPWDRPPYKTPIPCVSGFTFAAVVCKSFNLVAFKPVDYLEEFVAKAPNMKTIMFDIKHIDKLVKNYYRSH